MSNESMGSGELIDGHAASALLGVTRRHVHYLVRNGSLTPRYPRGKGLNTMHFHPEEVSALVAERERDDFDVKKLSARVAQAHALSRALERRVELLETLLGRHAWPLPSDEEAVVALYARAQDEQQRPTKKIAGVVEWSRLFMAMGEEFLDLTEAFTGDEDCWQVYTNLVDIMLIEAPIDRFSFDLELKAAYGYLDVGRRNLRASAFFYIRSRYGSHVANERFDTEECHSEIRTLATADW
jgi:hypothetical protein